MAPHLAPPSPTLTVSSGTSDNDQDIYDLNVPYKPSETSYKAGTPYPHYLPKWDPVFFPPLPPFDFTDPALRADPLKRSLLTSGVKAVPISPKMGTEIHGLQVSSLNSQQRDELALLVAERKVVVFRDQDFADIGPSNQQEFAKHFGKPNYQPISGSIPGFPGFHVIYRDGNTKEIDHFYDHKSSSTLWHHDVSYEHQPPGYVVLCILQCPDVGGDTVVASMTEAYNRLSPGFRAMLDNLTATHSSERLCSFARANGGLCRKDAVKSVHPVVRVHPVTGERSLFVNSEWITNIQGWRKSETEWLLKYLTDHVSQGHDFQIRLQWKPRTVVLFDNRSTLHTATVDYEGKERHMFRLASMAEKPIPVNK